jgi:alkanesulfonate monooxygenase SsuD/methylene tetrahydromethanopterin reductase-like flavin-dependent oxidoreductase (luciferase family)
MKKIGFLSFGHWTPSLHSQTRSASDALLQSIDLAMAAEQLGADGAYFRVHHFARQLSAPFPLLAAVGARTSRIEIGTGVIDMRYENPLYMAEDAATADLICGGRLQLGISRGSPEQVIEGYGYFGYVPAEGSDHADMAREHTRAFLRVITGEGFAEPNPQPMFPNPPGLLSIEPHSPGLRERIWWGAGSRATAEWTAQQGLNLMSSTLLTEDTGVPFHQLQAEQIRRFRDAGRPPATLGSRACRSAGASFPSSTTWIARTSGAMPRAETRSVGWRVAWPDSASRTPGSHRSWSRTSPRTRRSQPRTPCSSPFRTSSASTTTHTSSKACCATSRPSSAGAETVTVGRGLWR